MGENSLTPCARVFKEERKTHEGKAGAGGKVRSDHFFVERPLEDNGPVAKEANAMYRTPRGNKKGGKMSLREKRQGEKRDGKN